MNITDVAVPTDVPDSWAGIVAALFAGQAELMEKYRTIERLPEAPLSVHHASGQRVLKDFAWRTTEELAEAYEAFTKHGDTVTARLHCLEELADAFHFLIELLIFAGIGPDQASRLSPPSPTFGLVYHELAGDYWRMAYRLGLAMNYLKNKPWKQHQMPTDEAGFRQALLESWNALVDLWHLHGQSPTTLFQFYFRKHAVNQFRQRSNY